MLFLTRDLELIRAQLRGEVDLMMGDVDPADLLDDINTDTMTPAWVCFRHLPEEIALDAYAGLVDESGERVFGPRALMDGQFQVIVSGQRKGTGSSRETAPQAEKWSGIGMAVAASFAPIHARNNVGLGQLLGDYGQLERLQAGEELLLAELTSDFGPIRTAVTEAGGLFLFNRAHQAGDAKLDIPVCGERPMTIAEKILGAHLMDGPGYVEAGQACMVKVDGGYSHEFTSAQVHTFLEREFGDDYTVADPSKFAVFEDHLLYADGVERMAPHADRIQTLRDLQREFQVHTGVRDYSAVDGISPGICHQVAREEFVDPGDFIQATDSHTCMGGGNNALTWGVGATEYAALLHGGFTAIRVPGSIRFELTGELAPDVTAKDVMLHILSTFAVEEATLDRVMEFGGPGLAGLDMDERATLCNMATECSAATGVCEGDEKTAEWLAARRSGRSAADIAANFVLPDAGAAYVGGVHDVDLSIIRPMVARPGDPTYGAPVEGLGEVVIDIAYGGSCTAGKDRDVDLYAQVVSEALDAGRRVAAGVRFVVQFGSGSVALRARERGYLDLFERAGVEVIHPGCGACIGCGPGVSETADQVTVSAINRNFAGRSGPGQLYLASPLTVAASAFEGRIAPYSAGMFKGETSSREARTQ